MELKKLPTLLKNNILIQLPEIDEDEKGLSLGDIKTKPLLIAAVGALVTTIKVGDDVITRDGAVCIKAIRVGEVRYAMFIEREIEAIK